MSWETLHFEMKHCRTWIEYTLYKQNPRILELDRTGGEKLELWAELRSTNVQPKKFPPFTAHVQCLREILHPLIAGKTEE